MRKTLACAAVLALSANVHAVPIIDRPMAGAITQQSVQFGNGNFPDQWGVEARFPLIPPAVTFNPAPHITAEFIGRGGPFVDGDGENDGNHVAVPEPGTLALLGMGLLGVVLGSRRRSKRPTTPSRTITEKA